MSEFNFDVVLDPKYPEMKIIYNLSDFGKALELTNNTGKFLRVVVSEIDSPEFTAAKAEFDSWVHQ